MRSFYSPLSISAPFYGCLKLLSYAERKEVETRMRDPGIELRTSRGTQRPICCKMYYYTPVNENKMLLRHFQVILSVAGKTLSVPFSQQDKQEISQPAR